LFVIAIVPMARHSSGGFARWVFATDLQHRDRHWQNAYAERLIGSIRREVLDHVVVLGERRLRHLLLSYLTYHNAARTHLSLNKDAPVSREVQGVGRIFAKPHLGGLHHQYVRI
jgi:hypothetical protein